MKALTLIAPSTFAFETMDTPQPGAGEVLIQIKACGICGSDIHGMNGSSGRRIPPIVMGHEAAGVIAALGDGVSDWTIGARVTFDSTEYCGSCDACVEGKFNICQNRKVLGVSCKDYRRHGCFAEYVALPTRILHRIPDALSFEKAAFAEPVAIALHAVDLAPRPRSETSCAVVVGAGLIGLLVIQSLRTRGWQHIIAVDLDAGRLAIACELGASKGISARDENALQQIRDYAGTDGAEAAWEVVGAAAPFDLAVRCVQKNGTVVLVGNLQASVAFPLQEVVTRQITLRGSCACAGEYPEAVARISDGSIRVEPLLSICAPLADGAELFARLEAGKEPLMKVILTP